MGDTGDTRDMNAEEQSALRSLQESFRAEVLHSLAPFDLTEEDIHTALSLTQNWCCASFAHAFLEKKRDLIADEAGDAVIALRPSMIRKKWRVAFIDYLAEEKQLSGLKEFLYEFISALKARSATTKQSGASAQEMDTA